MSLVVGTKDSARRKKPTLDEYPINDYPYHQPWSGDMYNEHGYDDYYYYDDAGQPHYYDAHEGYDMYGGDQQYYNYQQDHEQSQHHHNHPNDYDRPVMEIVPPPEPQEEAVDEKTRLRRREQLLLPSQPPQEGESSSGSTSLAPSAPILTNGADHETNLAHHEVGMSSTPEPAASVTSARSTDTIRARSTSPPPISDTGGDVATDDKQELERRRLMAMASGPPVDEAEGSSSNPATLLVPSAPVVEENEYNAQTLNHDVDGSELPQYER